MPPVWEWAQWDGMKKKYCIYLLFICLFKYPCTCFCAIYYLNAWQNLPFNNMGLQRRQWHSTPVLLPGISHGWRNLEGCSPWGRWGLDTTERLHFHFPLSCIGEGNGNPLQCSYLENPRDGGAWWAAIYGVTQNRTRLKRFSSSSSRAQRPILRILFKALSSKLHSWSSQLGKLMNSHCCWNNFELAWNCKNSNSTLQIFSHYMDNLYFSYISKATSY